MPGDLTYVVISAVRSVEEFESIAAQAVRLKARGRVEMDVSSLAERSVRDIPPGGSPWHDYTSCLPSLEKIFPHRDLAPFLDMEHVKRNRQLLAQTLDVLRRHKMGAAAHFHIPWFLPEEFFEKYPQLRGPRIDHPRRSRREAFAMCVDTPEGRAFYADMFGQLVREVGELSSVHLSTNDAGGGLCWADWQYPGPNGPPHCRHRSVGQRVYDLISALREAAGGRAIDFDLRGNFSDVERREMAHFHDEHFAARAQHGQQPRFIVIASTVDSPVLGIFDPVAILKSLDRLRGTTPASKIVIDFRANYSRGHQTLAASEKVIELIDAYVAAPEFGLVGRTAFLRRLCAKWVGEEQADTLIETLHDLHDAFAYRAAAIPMFSANYVGLSMRHINRPLVAIPEKLSPEEEAWWLPHVFNPNLNEARIDYIDFHGGRLSAPKDIDQATNPAVLPIATFRAKLSSVADRLQALGGAGAEAFRRMGMALRIYASIFRSCGNFYATQRVRDRNLQKFAAGPQMPSKLASWSGDPDLQMLNEFMRDELDNTTELIGLLENGGMAQLLLAANPTDEDPFLLGPEIVSQLKQKCRIMRAHWLDAEQYLATPHK